MRRLYGADAALYAARRSADLLKAKQAEAAAIWAQIAAAISNADEDEDRKPGFERHAGDASAIA